MYSLVHIVRLSEIFFSLHLSLFLQEKQIQQPYVKTVSELGRKNDKTTVMVWRPLRLRTHLPAYH